MSQQANGPLAERYGRRPRRPRRWQIAVLASLVLGAVAWAVWAGLDHGTKDVTWEVTHFDTHDRDVVITFTLHRRTNVPVTCTFRARGRDGALVGEGSLDVPASRRPTVSSVYTLTTTARPVTGEIETCAPASDR
jgi:hypothetical protein